MDKSARFARTHPLASLGKDKHLFLPTPTSLQKDFSFRRLGTVGANVIINVTRGVALGVKKKKKKILYGYTVVFCHIPVTKMSHNCHIRSLPIFKKRDPKNKKMDQFK